MEVTNFSTLL